MKLLCWLLLIVSIYSDIPIFYYGEEAETVKLELKREGIDYIEKTEGRFNIIQYFEIKEDCFEINNIVIHNGEIFSLESREYKTGITKEKIETLMGIKYHVKMETDIRENIWSMKINNRIVEFHINNQTKVISKISPK